MLSFKSYRESLDRFKMGHEEYCSTRPVQNASNIQWFSNFRVPEWHRTLITHADSGAQAPEFYSKCLGRSPKPSFLMSCRVTLKQGVQQPHFGAFKPNNFPKEHLLQPPRTCHRQRASQGCWDFGCRAEGLRVGPGPRGGASHQAMLGPRGSEKARPRLFSAFP